MQHPTKIKTPSTMIKEVETEVIQPFHIPYYFSIKSVKESFIPEFSASLLDRLGSPYRALVIVPSGAVLFDIYVQHKTPIITQTPPFSANMMSNASLFFQAIWLVGPNCSTIPLMAFLVELTNFVGYNKCN
jgi:hypothetical protein